jgi:hypothetical protein
MLNIHYSEKALVQHQSCPDGAGLGLWPCSFCDKHLLQIFPKKNVLVQVGCFTYTKKGIKYNNFSIYLLLLLILFLWLQEILCVMCDLYMATYLSVTLTHLHLHLSYVLAVAKFSIPWTNVITDTQHHYVSHLHTHKHAYEHFYTK